MSTRPNRATRRASKRAVWARRNAEADLTTRQAMRPATGGRSKVSYQGSASGGYGSDWARAAHVGGADKPVLIDRRWTNTVTRNPADYGL